MRLFANIYLHNEHIGSIESDGLTCEVSLLDSYKNNPYRNSLSLSIMNMAKERIELFESPLAPLPPFIKSMLPEGILREYLIDQSGMVIDQDSFAADAYLLKVAGKDLPGAVEVRDVVTTGIKDDFNKDIVEPSLKDSERFSLSGVQQKFSLKRRNEKFHLPIKDESGDFILKPQPKGDKLPNLALNEYFHMALAKECGLDIPEIGLISHSELDEELALDKDAISFYIKRFDRDLDVKIHMEELHQALRLEGRINEKSKYEDFSVIDVLGFLYQVDQKYQTNLSEGYLKEMCYSFIIGNTDFHLKNTAILYPDRIKPVKAPSYDLMNTEFYGYSSLPLEMGLKIEPIFIHEFNEDVYLRLLEESACPFGYQEIYSDMENLVAQNYCAVLEDPFMKKFLTAYFKQKLIENFEQRFLSQDSFRPSI